MRLVVGTEHLNLLRHMLYDFYVRSPELKHLCANHYFTDGYEFEIGDYVLDRFLDVLDSLNTDGYHFEIVCFGPYLSKQLAKKVDFRVTNCNCQYYLAMPQAYIGLNDVA